MATLLRSSDIPALNATACCAVATGDKASPATLLGRGARACGQFPGLVLRAASQIILLLQACRRRRESPSGDERIKDFASARRKVVIAASWGETSAPRCGARMPSRLRTKPVVKCGPPSPMSCWRRDERHHVPNARFRQALFSPSEMCAINITISNDPRQRLGCVLYVTDDR